jgi:HEAT repeat protein
MVDKITILLAQLINGSPSDSAVAAQQLGAIGPPAVEPLLALLDATGSSRVWNALAAIGAPAVLPVAIRFRDRPHLLSHGEARVLAVDPSGWEALTAAAASAEAPARASAVHGLGKTGRPDAVPYVHRLLYDGSSDVRAEAVAAAGDLRDAASVARLVELASDEDAEVRGSTAWALARIGTKEAVAAFVATLDDPDITVRIAAVEAAREFRVVQALPILLARLEVADPGIGTGTEINAILEALASLPDPQAESAIIRLIESPHATWRADPKAAVYGDQAADVLELLDTPSSRAAASRWRQSHGGT